jgi:hypothetical protein
MYVKSCIFRDIMSYDLLKVNRHFRGTCHLYVQDQRIHKPSKEMSMKQLAGSGARTPDPTDNIFVFLTTHPLHKVSSIQGPV